MPVFAKVWVMFFFEKEADYISRYGAGPSFLQFGRAVTLSHLQAVTA
jgi:hypothetical protein